MDITFWHKQSTDKPLFPDIEWSKPENRLSAGKLLIVGGNVHGVAAPALAYKAAEQAGIGSAKVLLPDATKKMFGGMLDNAEFAPSTPSGSFGARALEPLQSLAQWADAVLLAGDNGRNSETAITYEKFVNSYRGQLTITQDALDYFLNSSQQLLQRVDTLVVASLAQLQKMIAQAGLLPAVYFSMDMVKLVEILHELTSSLAAMIITQHNGAVYIAVHGQVSTTTQNEPDAPWRVRTSAVASVYWLQHPTKPFEALTAAIFALNSV